MARLDLLLLTVCAILGSGSAALGAAELPLPLAPRLELRAGAADVTVPAADRAAAAAARAEAARVWARGPLDRDVPTRLFSWVASSSSEQDDSSGLLIVDRDGRDVEVLLDLHEGRDGFRSDASPKRALALMAARAAAAELAGEDESEEDPDDDPDLAPGDSADHVDSGSFGPREPLATIDLQLRWPSAWERACAWFRSTFAQRASGDADAAGADGGSPELTVTVTADEEILARSPYARRAVAAGLHVAEGQMAAQADRYRVLNAQLCFVDALLSVLLVGLLGLALCMWRDLLHRGDRDEDDDDDEQQGMSSPAKGGATAAPKTAAVAGGSPGPFSAEPFSLAARVPLLSKYLGAPVQIYSPLPTSTRAGAAEVAAREAARDAAAAAAAAAAARAATARAAAKQAEQLKASQLYVDVSELAASGARVLQRTTEGKST